jgi:predicted transcriptional regulator
MPTTQILFCINQTNCTPYILLVKFNVSRQFQAMRLAETVLTARPDICLVEAAKQMLSQQRKWLVVVDREGKTLGLVDRQILLNALAAG